MDWFIVFVIYIMGVFACFVGLHIRLYSDTTENLKHYKEDFPNTALFSLLSWAFVLLLLLVIFYEFLSSKYKVHTHTLGYDEFDNL